MLKDELRRGVTKPSDFTSTPCLFNQSLLLRRRHTKLPIPPHAIDDPLSRHLSRHDIFPSPNALSTGLEKRILFDQWRMRDESAFVAIIHFEQIRELRLVAALLPIVDSSSLLTHDAQDILREQAGM
jgi:hypothetical protein